MFIVMNRRVWDLIMGSVLGSDMTIDLVPDGTPPEMVKTSRLIVTLLPLTEMLDLMGRQHDTIRDLDSRLRAQQDQIARTRARLGLVIEFLCAKFEDAPEQFQI